MRRFIVISLCAVALAAAMPATPNAAAATRPIVIEGHGFGHGRGMGQYGARAAAAAGYSWKSILHFYYRGATLQRSSPGRINVLIGTASRVVVKSSGPMSIAWGSGRPFTATRRANVYYLIVRAGSSTVVYVSRAVRGPWKLVAVGHPRYVRIRGARTVGRVLYGATHWYRGMLQLLPSHSGFAVIDNLPIEQYLGEVVPREMPALWPIGGLQAQAVAARTYALRVLKHSRAVGRAYDICATTACQVFGGYAIAKGHSTRVLENPRTNAAVRSTAGLAMTWKGMPILAEYSSSTGGYTQSGGVPYLAAHPDPWDNSSPMHTWTETVSPAAIQKNWPVIGVFRGIAVVARDGRGDFGGRALRVRISGTRRAITVSAAEVMSAFDLPSDWFQFRPSAAPGRARPAAHPYRFRRDLSYGTTGSDVRALQLRLRAERMYPKNGPISDYFGSITLAAVKRYQRAHHIPATGFLGPKTRARLNATK